VCTLSVGLLTARDGWQAQSCTLGARSPPAAILRHAPPILRRTRVRRPGRARAAGRQGRARDVHPRRAGASSG
jgi:hypothetical protein